MTHAFTNDAALAQKGPRWLHQQRENAIARLSDAAWPSEADENWRYSRITQFDLEKFRPIALSELTAPGTEAAPGGGVWAAEVGKRAGLVVVRNGRVVHTELRPDLRALGVELTDVATLENGPLPERVNQVSKEAVDAFTLLHIGFMPGGALINVPGGVVVEDPIVILHWSEGEGRASFPHTTVLVGENSQLSVVERYGSSGEDHFVNGLVEFDLGDNANVKYLSVQELGPRTWQVATQRAHLGSAASFSSSAVAIGGDYARLRSEAKLAGAGANSKQLAVYYGDRDQMLDFRTRQEHVAPRTTSDLLFKGAVEDTASSVYSGLVHIAPEAQKSIATQTNRNLVLSEGATAESIPNLEIEANDVKCTHASAVGPIDDEQLYYLESRGVRPEVAQRLIVLGFFDDVFKNLSVPTLVGALQRAVAAKVGHMTWEASSE